MLNDIEPLIAFLLSDIDIVSYLILTVDQALDSMILNLSLLFCCLIYIE